MNVENIKRYYIPISRTFPKGHVNEGKPTYFEYKVLSALYPSCTYYPVKCEMC